MDIRPSNTKTKLQGCEDAYGALSLKVIFRKRALQLVALLLKMTCDLRHPMHLRHPVLNEVWHDSFMCATWIIHVWHDSFMCATWLIHEWHNTITNIHVPYALATRKAPTTWRATCDMTHSCVRRDSFICATWLVRMCGITQSCTHVLYTLATREDSYNMTS